MWLGSCELWYETFLNTEVKEQLVAKSMLWHAMSIFNELKEERHSEEEFVDHAVTILKCRYILLILQDFGYNLKCVGRLASFKIRQIISSPAKHNKRNINDILASCKVSIVILYCIFVYFLYLTSPCKIASPLYL